MDGHMSGKREMMGSDGRRESLERYLELESIQGMVWKPIVEGTSLDL